VNAALALARRYGIAVAFADLGDWGCAELRSEYDPRGPSIRLNARIAERLGSKALREFVTLAIAHEVYHHREHIGEIARLGNRAERERNADQFARTMATATE
jgi:hypothetical protein